MASRRASALLPALARGTRPMRPLRQPPALAAHLVSRPSQFILPSALRLAHSIPRPTPSPSPSAAAAASSFSSSSSSSSSAAISKKGTDTDPSESKEAEAALAPHYELTFTCVPCGTRSAHRITKQGYHHGSVLITCPSCRNRHVIADHLRIFGDRAVTVEQLVRERGGRGLVKKGALGEDGDVEFWDDGSETSRAERTRAEDVQSYRPPPSQTTEGKEGEDGGSGSSTAAPGASFASAKASGGGAADTPAR